MKMYFVNYLWFIFLVSLYYALYKLNVIKKLDKDYHILFLALYFAYTGSAIFKFDILKTLLYSMTNFIYVELVINIFITHKDGNNSKKKGSKGKRKV